MVTSFVDNGSLRIHAAGKMNKSASPSFGKKIFKARAKNPDIPLVLDMKGLKQITASGLNLILRIFEQERVFKIVNLTDKMYKIFQNSGFTDFLDIEEPKTVKIF